MELTSHLKNNTYYYGGGYYFDIIHDAESRCYDAWLYSGKSAGRMYLGSCQDAVSQKRLIETVRTRIAASLPAFRLSVS